MLDEIWRPHGIPSNAGQLRDDENLEGWDRLDDGDQAIELRPVLPLGAGDRFVGVDMVVGHGPAALGRKLAGMLDLTRGRARVLVAV